MPTPIRVTKIHHACLTVDDGSTRLLLDPGRFGPRPDLDGIDAVLITHRHFDHFDPELVEEALGRGVPVWMPGDAFGDLGDSSGAVGDNLHEAVAGATLRIGALTVRVSGGRHAEVHPTIPGPENRAYLIDERVLVTEPMGADRFTCCNTARVPNPTCTSFNSKAASPSTSCLFHPYRELFGPPVENCFESLSSVPLCPGS